MEIECKYHGLTEHAIRKSGGFRCKKCSVEAVTNWRRRLKQKAIDYMGGQCHCCGYDKCNDALEFHHRDPNEKDFGIGANGHTRAWEKVKIELDKCVMVCANCHREIHAGLRQIE